MTSATLRGLARFVVLVAIANLAALAPARAADAVLSGAITSSAGEPIAGVTVSAKAQGATITTTVFTDQHGNYFFPPLPAAKYRVWAQALTFATARGEVDLVACQAPGFRAGAVGGFRPPAARRRVAGVAAGYDKRRPAYEAPRAQRLHRLSYAELRAAASVRSGRLVEDHRVDETRQCRRHLSRPRSQAARVARFPSAGTCRLSGAGPRPRRSRPQSQATSQAERRSGARRVHRIRPAA